LFGSTVFSIDPYQIGLGNDEAIEAGAFWFYRKLGFRSTDPQIERMARREEKRIAKNPSHRTSRRMLRRMARSPMAYGNRHWDRFRIHNLVGKRFRLPPDLQRAKHGRTEQRYLRLLASNEQIRRALLKLGS
ncbi:MAG TPA: hypothetical protein VII12_12700, partial [Thermoanaerobaculia bacterium]